MGSNRKDTSLHGNAPDTADTALLLVDVINDLEFEGGEKLVPHALEMAGKIAQLKKTLVGLGIPCIYANDNFGKWRSDLRGVVERCLTEPVRGRPVVEKLKPGENDYFVLKPKHSAFYASALGLLLDHLGAKRLVITGMAADMCIFSTAYDAHIRDFKLIIPEDCVASFSAKEKTEALQMMARVLKADIRSSDEIVQVLTSENHRSIQETT